MQELISVVLIIQKCVPTLSKSLWQRLNYPMGAIAKCLHLETRWGGELQLSQPNVEAVM